MVVDVKVGFDLRKLSTRLDDIGKKVATRAANSAINKTAASVKVRATKEISKETGLTQKVIRKQIDITRSNRGTLRAAVSAKGSAINVIEFVAPSRRTTKAFRKRQGVTAKPWRKRRVFKGTFIGHGKNSGKPLVFKRTSKNPYPIKAIHGPSIPRTFIEERVNKLLVNTARELFRKNLKRDLDFFMSKLK